MTIDVSLIVGAGQSGVESMTGKQSLRSLEIVDRLSDATGTWVMFVRRVDGLDRHAAKNLLLAAEATGAALAMGGAQAELEVLTGVQVQSRSPFMDVHGVLFNRQWLHARQPLGDELAQGVREIATTVLGSTETIALISQAIIAGPPPTVIDGSKAVVRAGPVSRLAGLAFSVARVLPLSPRVVIDV
ncbi:MAG: hypothetical protein Q8L05_07680, partial [Actinomycetota bacterium]|nr:hypothetical protein [Actinomycetota bacterium]